MSDTSRQLRNWLQSLDDADLSTILSFCGPVGKPVSVGQHDHDKRLDRRPLPERELRSTRVWLLKAPTLQVERLALEAVSRAAEVLLTKSNVDAALIEKPNREQLGKLLTSLGLPIGRLVLFGLLIGDLPASAVAALNYAELEMGLANAQRTFPTEGMDVPPSAKSATTACTSVVRVSREVDGSEVDMIGDLLSQLKGLAALLEDLLTLASDSIRIGRPAVSITRQLDEYTNLRDRISTVLVDLCRCDKYYSRGFTLGVA